MGGYNLPTFRRLQPFKLLYTPYIARRLQLDLLASLGLHIEYKQNCKADILRKKVDFARNRINNEDIETAETLKLLGVTIDSRLNFSEHVNSACKKLKPVKELLPSYD